MTNAPEPFVGISYAIADAAAARIGRTDPDLANAVLLPLAIMGGRDGIIGQAGLQDFLWSHMPAMMMPDEWPGILTGLAHLFDDLGHSRYAAIVRSRTTLEVLDSYENNGSTGLLVARARRASGVHVSDTDSFGWSDTLHSTEAVAHRLVEAALELAVVDGQIELGAPGWTNELKRLTQRILDTPHDELLGQTPLSLVYTERIAGWIDDTGNDATRQARAALGTLFLSPIEPPDDLPAAVAAMVAVLGRVAAVGRVGVVGRVGDGAAVDDRFVATIAAELGWSGPTTEPAVLVARLVDNARRLGWVRRTGDQVKLTPRGRAVVTEPERLWRLASSLLPGHGRTANRVGETLATVLLAGPADHADLYERCIEYSQGYDQPSFVPRFWPEQLAEAACDELGLWQVLGLVDATGLVLTPLGWATVAEYLRSLAVAPTARPAVWARAGEAGADGRPG